MLLVHFVAVLVPLAAILLLFTVLWPAARLRLGIITPLVALVALVLVPIATDAGEWLEHQVAPDPLVRVHTELGDQLLYWSIGVFIVAAVWWLFHDARTGAWIRSHAPGVITGKAATAALVAAAVALSVGSMVQVYRIGDSGAQAVWHDQLKPITTSG